MVRLKKNDFIPVRLSISFGGFSHWDVLKSFRTCVGIYINQNRIYYLDNLKKKDSELCVSQNVKVLHFIQTFYFESVVL